MPPQLTIRPASADDMAEIRTWADSDTGPTGYVGAYDPLANLIDMSDPQGGWAALENGELIAFASLTEDAAHQAHLGFIVKPTRRREGIAKSFISALVDRQELDHFAKIVGTPHMENMAAQKILVRAGFQQMGYNQDGMPLFERG